MGTLHARKLAALELDPGEVHRRAAGRLPAGAGVELVGIADIAVARARRLCERLHGRAVRDFRELLPHCDAAVVAVPTLAHFDVVREVLAAGKDVLVEKPIAATLEQAESLLALAAASGRVLQVGHLEWFNSAMGVLRGHLREPRFIEAHRMGPYPDRPTDIDVVRDLMIHDLDIVQQLLGREPVQIDAVGVPVVTARADIANARLVYAGGAGDGVGYGAGDGAGGIVANLTASRVSPHRMRRLRFFQAGRYFSIDFLDQTATVYRRREGRAGDPRAFEVEKLDVDRGDALHAQLAAFAAACFTRERPHVDGREGLGALRTALRVSRAMPLAPAVDPT